MSDAIAVALIVGAMGALGPLVLGFLVSRQHERERHEDWARQDELTGRLDQIHGLVNSGLTRQMEEAYQALCQQALLMRQMALWEHPDGHEPSPEALRAIEVIEAKASDLRSRLNCR